MMESRKRPGSPAEDPTASKKRALMSATGAPAHVNGLDDTEQAEPSEDSNLELFRKEAIYRRMRHYAREHERGRQRIEELEAARETYQASMQAIETCWNQLISEIRALVSLDDNKASTRVKLPKVTSDVAAYESALEEKSAETKSLVNRFVAHAGSHPVDTASLQAARREAESEALRLQSECELLRSQVDDANEQIDKLRNDLESAENRAERLRRESSRAPPTQPGSVRVPDQDVDVKPKREPSLPSAPQPSAASNGHIEHLDVEKIESAQVEACMALIKKKDKEIADLLQENASLNFMKGKKEDELSKLKEDMRLIKQTTKEQALEQLSQEQIKEAVKQQLMEPLALYERYKQENLEFYTNRTAFEAKFENAAAEQLQELKAQLERATEDTIRIRAERDAAKNELTERKAALQEKFASIREFKALAEARQERILSLQSEVQRLKARLAAEAGDEDLFSFFSTQADDQASFVDDLRKRLRNAEDKLKAQQDIIDAHTEVGSENYEYLQAELQAREQCEGLRRRLERYEITYGPQALQTAAPDVRALAQTLEEKEKALNESELLRKQEAEALNALYTDVDRLSASWEALERQVSSKVYDLSSMEEKLQRTIADKSKLDYKFFALMPVKELAEMEVKSLTQQVDLLNKRIALLEDEKKDIKSSTTMHEQVVASWQKEEELLKKRISTLEGRIKNFEENAKANEDVKRQAQIACEAAVKQNKDLEITVADHTKSLAGAKAQVKQLSDKVDQLKRSAASAAGADDIQKQLDWSLSVLKCSTCKQGFREQVLVKCGHTFCKGCIDSRLSTRQRKCPACNLPFAQSDVLPMYMQ